MAKKKSGSDGRILMAGESLEDVMVEVCALHGVQARGRMVKEIGV